MKRILYISPDFNYNCGRSKLVFLFLDYFRKKSNYEVHFITNGGDSLERLKKIGIDYKILSFYDGLKNIFYSKKFFNKLQDYLIKHEIQLIHSHHRFPEYISVKAAKALNIKTVASAHSFVKGYKRFSFKSDKIICVSNSVSAYLKKEYNIEKERLITLYNPLDNSPEPAPERLSELKAEIGISPGDKIILFMGRINYEKGCDVLLKAFPFVKKGCNNVRLLLCGNLKDKNLKKMISSEDNSIKIIHPRLNQNLFYGIADCVVLPSRSETLSFVMIEAGSFKKAFIGGNTGGISEFIEDGKDGLLTAPGNYIELAEKILYLLKNEEAARVLGENLYQKVALHCDYKSYFAKAEEIYNSLLTNP